MLVYPKSRHYIMSKDNEHQKRKREVEARQVQSLSKMVEKLNNENNNLRGMLSKVDVLRQEMYSKL